MDIMEAIFNRRSIRKFLDKAVPENIIEELLKAAMYAPSPHNEQSWQYIVIQNKKSLETISKMHQYVRMCRGAPLAILVCGDLQHQTEYEPGVWPLSCAMAAQNILLTAHARGLGAVCTTVYPFVDRIMKLRELLTLPEHVVPLALIVLGYPNERPLQPDDRFKKERVHFEKWTT